MLPVSVLIALVPPAGRPSAGSSSSDGSTGAGSIFSVICPKISTGWKKIAPAGWYGRHVFATLLVSGTSYQEHLIKFG